MDADRLETSSPILLLPSALLPPTAYSDLIDALGRRGRVLLPAADHPHLTSPAAAHPVTPTPESLEAMGAGRLAIVAVGEACYGALRLATAGRLELERLVLLAPTAGASDETSPLLRRFASLLRITTPMPIAPSQNMFADAWIRANPEAARAYDAWLVGAAAERAADALDAVADAPNLLAWLSRVQCPVYVRVGTGDRLTTAHQARRIAAHFDYGRIDFVLGAGHGVLIEDGDRTVGAMVDGLVGYGRPSRRVGSLAR